MRERREQERQKTLRQQQQSHAGTRELHAIAATLDAVRAHLLASALGRESDPVFAASFRRLARLDVSCACCSSRTGGDHHGVRMTRLLLVEELHRFGKDLNLDLSAFAVHTAREASRRHRCCQPTRGGARAAARAETRRTLPAPCRGGRLGSQHGIRCGVRGTPPRECRRRRRERPNCACLRRRPARRRRQGLPWCAAARGSHGDGARGALQLRRPGQGGREDGRAARPVRVRRHRLFFSPLRRCGARLRRGRERRLRGGERR